ncbi:MAG: porin family protein [Gemmatimonadetes bacterium]|nr:porin family protein [Gemmatimonadota bacterium]
MRKTLLAGVLAIFVAGPVAAQEVQPVVHDGSRSINFTFNGLGSFGLAGTGVNGGLGMSFFRSRDRAIRLGLQMGYDRSTSPWNGVGAGSDGLSTSWRLGVGADLLRYKDAMSGRVRPYIGVGVSIATASSDQKPAVSDNAPDGTLIETKNSNANDGLTIGTRGILGAEFFIFPEVSISAEYTLNLVSYTRRADMGTSYKNLPEVTTKRGSALTVLGFGAGGAMVHIYF